MEIEQNRCQIEGAVSQSYPYLRGVYPHCRVISDTPKPHSTKRRNDEQVRPNSPNSQEEIHDSFLAAINTNRLDVCEVEGPKIDLCQGDVGSGRDLVYETLQRFLVDDDLFHWCVWSRR